MSIGLTPARVYARGPRGMRLRASNYLNPVNIPRNKRGERKEEKEGPARPVVETACGWNAVPRMGRGSLRVRQLANRERQRQRARRSCLCPRNI